MRATVDECIFVRMIRGPFAGLYGVILKHPVYDDGLIEFKFPPRGRAACLRSEYEIISEDEYKTLEVISS